MCCVTQDQHYMQLMSSSVAFNSSNITYKSTHPERQLQCALIKYTNQRTASCGNIRSLVYSFTAERNQLVAGTCTYLLQGKFLNSTPPFVAYILLTSRRQLVVNENLQVLALHKRQNESGGCTELESSQLLFHLPYIAIKQTHTCVHLHALTSHTLHVHT